MKRETLIDYKDDLLNDSLSDGRKYNIIKHYIIYGCEGISNLNEEEINLITECGFDLENFESNDNFELYALEREEYYNNVLKPQINSLNRR